MPPDTIYFAQQEKQAMSKITIALTAAAIALASPTLGASNHDTGSTHLAQYCLPQDEIPGGQTLYC
jgi:hypothetical protein